MKTLAEKWEEYALVAIPQGAGPAQRQGTRMAFYAGATVMFNLVNDASADPRSLEEGEKLLSALDNELRAYVKDMREGKA